jgi:hypothetical protein
LPGFGVYHLQIAAIFLVAPIDDASAARNRGSRDADPSDQQDAYGDDDG